MHRLMLSVLLACAVPACACAQQSSPASTARDAAPAASTAKPKSHNAFGEAIAELTRVAREQAAATRAQETPARAPGAHATASTAPVGTAPALADSSGG